MIYLKRIIYLLFCVLSFICLFTIIIPMIYYIVTGRPYAEIDHNFKNAINLY